MPVDFIELVLRSAMFVFLLYVGFLLARGLGRLVKSIFNGVRNPQAVARKAGEITAAATERVSQTSKSLSESFKDGYNKR